jgi:hypothetical protein
MQSITPQLGLQLLATLVSLTAAAASIFFAIRSRRDARIQRRFQGLALRRQLDGELRKWADEVVMAMAEAGVLAESSRLDATGTQGLMELEARLSGLADRGRWFLPNTGERPHEDFKPKAYRGLRQPALDHVVDAVRVVEALRSGELNSPKRRASELTELRRYFVSELQSIMDPRARESETADLARELNR